MRLLLDTHIALWAATDLKQLGAEAARLIEHAEETYFSAISVWELSIKHAVIRRGVRQFHLSGREVLNLFEAIDLVPLALTPEHGAEVDHLPLHHGDPFDRGMLAQARVEGLTFLTRDAALERYGHPVRLV